MPKNCTKVNSKMTRTEKIKYINEALQHEIENSTMGAADYRQILRQCYRVGISEGELEQYIAIRQARGELKQQQAGRAYYIVLTT